MNTALLLGAGFSHNWGGRLAKEVMGVLLGHPDVARNLELRRILFDHADTGFENALGQVQREALEDPTSESKQNRLTAMQDAVSDMFRVMNEAFYEILEFESHNNRTGTIRQFLTRFDAIFTLNQDLLLEHHYIDTFDVSLEMPRRWDAVQLLGMRRTPSTDPMFASSWARSAWHPAPESEYRLEERAQPYFKLHGSSNWNSTGGTALLIMGDGKDEAIDGHAILRRYQQEFSAYLCRPNTRLVVIGYGFRDHHINRAIADAAYKHDLRMFIISPDGHNLARVLKSKDLPAADLIVYGYDLADIFARSVIGISQRPLRETFGKDAIERQNVERFLAG